jgi:hypothetical protein
LSRCLSQFSRTVREISKGLGGLSGILATVCTREQYAKGVTQEDIKTTNDHDIAKPGITGLGVGSSEARSCAPVLKHKQCGLDKHVSTRC